MSGNDVKGDVLMLWVFSHNVGEVRQSPVQPFTNITETIIYPSSG